MAELGINQRGIAERAALTADTVSDFVSGKRWAREDTIAKVEAALEWPPGEIERLASDEPVSPTGDSALMSIPAEAVAGMTSAQLAELRARIESEAWAYRREVGM